MALHAIYSLCQHLLKFPELRLMSPSPPASHPHALDPRENVSLSLFWQRARTRERGLGVPRGFFPSPLKFWAPMFSSGFGSRDHTESPAYLDTSDWLLHGDLREAQSWARPRNPGVAHTGETGGVRCGVRSSSCAPRRLLQVAGDR